MQKGQKIILQPMTPAQIVQANKEKLASDNTKVDAKSAKQSVIKLKNHVSFIYITATTFFRP